MKHIICRLEPIGDTKYCIIKHAAFVYLFLFLAIVKSQSSLGEAKCNSIRDVQYRTVFRSLVSGAFHFAIVK